MLIKLEAKGFTASNLVLGIGSYTYQMVTRDTHGFAIKATYGEINGEPREIFKDPKTGSGKKKSAKGRLAVLHDGTKFILKDQVVDNVPGDCLDLVFRNGVIFKDTSLEEIRKRLI